MAKKTILVDEKTLLRIAEKGYGDRNAGLLPPTLQDAYQDWGKKHGDSFSDFLVVELCEASAMSGDGEGNLAKFSLDEAIGAILHIIEDCDNVLCELEDVRLTGTVPEDEDDD